MKKRLISLLLTAVMAMGLTACGGKDGHMTVTIEGKKYDLSGDFQNVVGDMVKDDVRVIFNITKTSEFDETGHWCPIEDGDEVLEDKHIFAGDYTFGRYEGTIGDMICQYHMIGSGDINYETADGIKNDSKAEDVERLKNYIRQNGIENSEGETYAALYVDGKIVELSEYEDAYEEFMEDIEDEIARADRGKGFFDEIGIFSDTYYGYAGGINKRLKSMSQAMENDMMEEFREEYPYFEEDVLFNMAIKDAGEKLIAGDIDSYTVIFYEFGKDADNEGVITHFYHYYLDENYDATKFLPVKSD